MIDVILPALDEAAALPWVLGAFPDGYRPIVVDNGSTDATASIAASLGVEVVCEPRRGFGAACFAGLQAATSEIVCFMDCDGSLDPADLARVAGPVAAGTADLVLGNRRPTAKTAWPLHARVANQVLARWVAFRTGLHITDLGPMRAARRAELLALDIADRRFGWPLEMVLLASEHNWRIGEVDVAYMPRLGRSKVTGTLSGTTRTIRDMASVLQR